MVGCIPILLNSNLMVIKNFKKNLLIAIILGIVVGCIMAQAYFYLFGSAMVEYIQIWPIKIVAYILMFPFIIGASACDLLSIESYTCITSFYFVFPISYALLFAVIYSLYYRLRK